MRAVFAVLVQAGRPQPWQAPTGKGGLRGLRVWCKEVQYFETLNLYEGSGPLG